MKKRILSMLLTLLMVISVFPISASAAESASVSVTENENQSDGVILRKSATPKADGSVDISIEAYTTGLVSQTTVATPTDIVLVLDMSGSMSSTVASSTTTWTYTAVNGEREWDWGYNYGYFSTNSSSTKYYVLVDGTYREVARVDDDSNGYYYYRYYDASNTAVYVYPIMQNSGRDNDQVIAFYRKGLLFAFNFNPTQSFTKVEVPVPNNADYEVRLSSDDAAYGGQDRIAHIEYKAREKDGKYFVDLYLPARTAVVLKEGRIRKGKAAKK